MEEITCTHPRTVIQQDEFLKEIFWCKCLACGLVWQFRNMQNEEKIVHQLGKYYDFLYPIALALVKQDRLSEYEMPFELRTDEWWCWYLKSDKSLEKSLFIPERFLQNDNVKLLVMENPNLLKYINPTSLNEDTIYRAFQKQPSIFKDIFQHKTEKMCYQAIQMDGLNLKVTPSALMTSELCWMAIGQNGLAIQYVPKDLRTLEMVKTAIDHCYDCACEVYLWKEYIKKYKSKSQPDLLLVFGK